jgi:REP element-mobilizing transposase RayT
MGRPPRLLGPGLVYHVYARGNRRQDIFLDGRDYRAYLARLARYRTKHDAIVYAYCLMPNHVHILIRTGLVPLSLLMQGIQQSYTQYFNRRHSVIGHLFQGRYKASVCTEEAYLATLIHYIHANPVRAGLAASPQLYRYSSHAAYRDGRPTALVDPRPVLQMLGSLVSSQPTPAPDPPSGPPEQPPGPRDRRTLATSPEQAVDELARQLQVEPAAIRSADRSWAISTARALVAFTLVRRLGYPVRAVAEVLGRDVTTVSVILHRLAPRLAAERRLAAAVDRLAQPENV